MKRLLQGKISSRYPAEQVNPMDGVANLADVMLILAVGIMLALVMHWNVDIGAGAFRDGRSADTEEAIVIDGDRLKEVGGDVTQVDGGDMERLGEVFYDAASGDCYIIVD